MAENEVKERVTVEADQALRELDRLAQAHREYASGMKANQAGARDLSNQLDTLYDRNVQSARAMAQGGATAGDVAGKLTLKQRVVGGLANSISAMTASWLGFVAGGAAIIGMIRDIAAAATESVKAVAALGAEVRGLTANVGATQASRLIRPLTGIAAENRFNVAGRGQLVEAVSTLTDLREGLSDQQILGSARNLAAIQRATGVGGAQAARLLLSAEENLGLTQDQAVDFVVSSLNSGIEAQPLQDVVERGGNVGGMEFVGAVLAARSTGLDVNRAGRSLPTLLSALTRRDKAGNVAEDLRQAGVTSGMSVTQRLLALRAAQQAGTISEGQYETLLGGTENRRITDPIMRALDRNLLPASMASLTDPQAAERALAELDANPFVRVQEQQQLRGLLAQVLRERRGMTGFGAAVEQQYAQTQDLPGGIRQVSQVAGVISSLLSGESAADMERRNVTTVRARTMAELREIYVIGNQFNTGVDPRTDVRPRSPSGQ